jgi:hypothetical protein
MVYWIAYLLKDSNGNGSNLAECRYIFIYFSDFKADRIQSIALIMMMASIISPFINAIATTLFFIYLLIKHRLIETTIRTIILPLCSCRAVNTTLK